MNDHVVASWLGRVKIETISLINIYIHWSNKAVNIIMINIFREKCNISKHKGMLVVCIEKIKHF